MLNSYMIMVARDSLTLNYIDIGMCMLVLKGVNWICAQLARPGCNSHHIIYSNRCVRPFLASYSYSSVRCGETTALAT